MNSPRVLVVLSTEASWSRGVLRGFMEATRDHDWTLLHYHPASNLSWLIDEWSPAAAVIGPEVGAETMAPLASAALVSVTVDRTADRIASVCLDEKRIAGLALEHLLAETTELSIAEVARRSGFTTLALLNIAFRREFGIPSGAYRRRVQEQRRALHCATTCPKNMP